MILCGVEVGLCLVCLGNKKIGVVGVERVKVEIY